MNFKKFPHRFSLEKAVSTYISAYSHQNHSLTEVCTSHPPTLSMIEWIHSFISICRFTLPIIITQSSIHSFTHPSIHPFIHAYVLRHFIHLVIHTFICPMSSFIWKSNIIIAYRKQASLPWKENHKFTRNGCSSEDSNSTSLSTPPKAPRLSHAERLTYFMAYKTPLSRFCTIHTCKEITEEM